MQHLRQLQDSNILIKYGEEEREETAVNLTKNSNISQESLIQNKIKIQDFEPKLLKSKSNSSLSNLGQSQS